MFEGIHKGIGQAPTSLAAESHKRNKKAGDTKTWAISRAGADTCRLWRLL